MDTIIESEVRIYSFDLILGAINDSIEKGKIFINTKKIRRFLNIQSENRSRINFIWRSLEFLVGQGYLEVFSTKSPKIYRLPKEKIQLRCEK